MEQINKTIVITYDDATRMVDFCKNNEGDVSKEFYDWYLGEGEFFSKSGMLIIDGIYSDKQRVAMSFDFNNPDVAEFNIYRYTDQSIICNFFFYRQQNLTMHNASIDVKYFSLHYFRHQKRIWMSPEMKEKAKTIATGIIQAEMLRRKKGGRAKSSDELYEESLKVSSKEFNTFNCQTLVYFIYAMMFYVSKQEPEEITTEFKKEIASQGEKASSIYKYTGYIDLRENKTYRPIIKKDPDEPVREYERHIQKWTVRGHYRKTKNGKVWIEQHTRGEGELEKRIYGTENEEDLNLIPKVFEVQRTKTEADVVDKKQAETIIPEQKNTTKPTINMTTNNQSEEGYKEKFEELERMNQGMREDHKEWDENSKLVQLFLIEWSYHCGFRFLLFNLDLKKPKVNGALFGFEIAFWEERACFYIHLLHKQIKIYDRDFE